MGCSRHPDAAERWCGRVLRCAAPGNDSGICGVYLAEKGTLKKDPTCYEYPAKRTFFCPLCGERNEHADCEPLKAGGVVVHGAYRVWCHECSHKGIIRD